MEPKKDSKDMQKNTFLFVFSLLALIRFVNVKVGIFLSLKTKGGTTNVFGKKDSTSECDPHIWN